MYAQNSLGAHAFLKKPHSYVVDLTPDNFNRVVKDTTKNVLVEFYAPCENHFVLYIIYLYTGRVIAHSTVSVGCMFLLGPLTGKINYYSEKIMGGSCLQTIVHLYMYMLPLA